MKDASGSPRPTLASPVTGTLIVATPGGTSNSSPVVGLVMETASCAPFDSDVLLDPAIRSVVPSASARATAGNRERGPRCLCVMLQLLPKNSVSDDVQMRTNSVDQRHAPPFSL